VVLRVALGANAVVALAVLVSHAGWPAAWARFVELSALLEPSLLMSLLAWCALRRFLSQLPLNWQRLLAWLTPAACTAVTLLIIGPIGPDLSAGPRWAALLVALAIGIAVQHYFELRARAFSPAVTEARFQALQSRIRPHFFFNSLNAVIAVVRSDPLRAERMLESVADLFRAIMGDVRKLVRWSRSWIFAASTSRSSRRASASACRSTGTSAPCTRARACRSCCCSR